MNKKDKNQTFKNYFDEVKMQMKTSNKNDIDEDELKSIINIINSCKFDSDIDFLECFKNQIYYIIKSDKYQNFFALNSKKIQIF